jgi:hypothetical protein
MNEDELIKRAQMRLRDAGSRPESMTADEMLILDLLAALQARQRRDR